MLSYKFVKILLIFLAVLKVAKASVIFYGEQEAMKMTVSLSVRVPKEATEQDITQAILTHFAQQCKVSPFSNGHFRYNEENISRYIKDLTLLESLKQEIKGIQKTIDPQLCRIFIVDGERTVVKHQNIETKNLECWDIFPLIPLKNEHVLQNNTKYVPSATAQHTMSGATYKPTEVSSSMIPFENRTEAPSILEEKPSLLHLVKYESPVEHTEGKSVFQPLLPRDHPEILLEETHLKTPKLIRDWLKLIYFYKNSMEYAFAFYVLLFFTFVVILLRCGKRAQPSVVKK